MKNKLRKKKNKFSMKKEEKIYELIFRFYQEIGKK